MVLNWEFFVVGMWLMRGRLSPQLPRHAGRNVHDSQGQPGRHHPRVGFIRQFGDGKPLWRALRGNTRYSYGNSKTNKNRFAPGRRNPATPA
jgi:hypothetical protein